MADQQTWRTFIAVQLPAEVKDALRAPLKALEEMSRLVRASPLDGIHLTLHFLGEIEPGRVANLEASLMPVIAAQTGFGVEAVGVGAFPTIARPRTLWAGIEGEEKGKLISLQASIGEVLEKGLFPVEAREYSPHLTLGRLRRPPGAADRKALLRWRDEWRSRPLGKIPVDRISLMRSHLSAGPPRHTVLQTFGLK